jgi:hypothetical protein
MQALLAKALSSIGIYLIEFLTKAIMTFVAKSQRDAKNKKKIKEALAHEDRKEAARRINEIFSK